MTKKQQLYHNKEPKVKQKRFRKCKYCGDKSIPYGSLQPFCFKNECIKAHNIKTKSLEKREAKRELNLNDKRKQMKICQDLAQEIGRYHGALSGITKCVTCGIDLYTQMQIDGGHFLPKNNWSAIKLYTLQIHPQCVGCNNFGSGEREAYRRFMVERYGEEKTAWLESFKGVTRKYTLEYLWRYKKIMGKRARVLRKRIIDKGLGDIYT